MSKKIFIGGAWPYANGDLHIGHIAAMLPGDILARYFRLIGNEVLYVSGSDCHGTPISIRAAAEKVEPREIASRYHEAFKKCFDDLGFSFDLYTKTDSEFHHEEVQNIFKKLYEKGVIYKKSVEQTYCSHCSKFLPDRYVEGICPHCGNIARGDQCDYCSSLLDPVELKDKKCKLCGNEPELRETEHLFINLANFQGEIQEYVNKAQGWRENSLGLTQRYINEGLQERAVTRDLPWGISVPIKGFQDKKVYVWIEAVSGYLTASKYWSKLTGEAWEKFWKGEDITSYYVHGKDNIPFHSIILPAILLGLDENYHLPDRIVSSEYLTLEGEKISTSRDYAIWAPYILENYNPDSIRYFLTINAPEKRDGDFSWREFITRNNSELLGAYGNFVNRSLVFAQKYFQGNIPEGKADENIKLKLKELYGIIGEDIENANLKGALEKIFEFVRASNKYFDENRPWITIKENEKICSDTIYNCILIISNLSNLLEPFLPFSSEKIRGFLGIENAKWDYIEPEANTKVNNVEILFDRIDKKRIEEETNKLAIKAKA
ncbi:methionine--tRNA ligase [Clostridium sp. 19966]|uniref:methionine--tRNA ligase n=1 Tax=Clostridium sp. 19966 TaxID=2768166 RepID=UPI0028DE7041|nr:methionine--tRNA ligase [Clostridium sp. 19966]MDT8719625.1 methionine--tRNA ligase [Clostridium sp. 19966]